MTIEQLQYFYTISLTKSFSQAAIETNITQSALSKQIAKLEEELGVFLFDRTHRQIALTNEGQQLLKDVKNILKDYNHMQEHLISMKETNHNTIKIAMLPIFSQYDLAHKINDFKINHPQFHLTIDEIEERDLSNQLNYHHYDIYILRGHHQELEQFQSLLLYEDNLVAIVSKNNPLSKQKSLSLQQLQNQKLLLPPKYTTIATMAIEACQHAGFHPHIHRHGRTETILSAAKENEGIALLMKKSLHIFHLSDMVVLPFDSKIEGNIYLYYSTQSSHQEAIQEFINTIQPQKYK